MPKDTTRIKKRASTHGRARTTASPGWPPSELDLDAKVSIAVTINFCTSSAQPSQINKGKALERYQLKPQQLRDLDFQREL